MSYLRINISSFFSINFLRFFLWFRNDFRHCRGVNLVGGTLEYKFKISSNRQKLIYEWLEKSKEEIFGLPRNSLCVKVWFQKQKKTVVLLTEFYLSWKEILLTSNWVLLFTCTVVQFVKRIYQLSSLRNYICIVVVYYSNDACVDIWTQHSNSVAIINGNKTEV